MARVVSLFLPTWPTDRVQRREGGAGVPAETPLALAGCEGSRRVLKAAPLRALDPGRRQARSARGLPRPSHVYVIAAATNAARD